jgi:hypothetical protein
MICVWLRRLLGSLRGKDDKAGDPALASPASCR